MSAASALQKAIFERLSGDAALTALLGPDGVTDRLLARARLPLVAIRAIDSTDRSTGTDMDEEHAVVLEVWSDAAGHLETQAIAAAVKVALHDADLTLDGHHLVSLLHRTTRLSRDSKTRFHRAEMRFRAVTELP
jgi:hypothetical protein